MAPNLYANIPTPTADPSTTKKPASAKQLAALEKGRAAKKKKNSETFPEDPETIATPELINDIPNTTEKSAIEVPNTAELEIPKAVKPIYTPPPDSEPPLWFKNYIGQKIEERVTNLSKKKVVRKKPAPKVPLPEEPKPLELREQPQEPQRPLRPVRNFSVRATSRNSIFK